MSPSESAISNKTPDSAPEQTGYGGIGKRIGSVLYVLLCIEIGIFLLVVPWSVIWDYHWLAGYHPSLSPILMSFYVRGAISGLGLVNLWLGISQAWNFRQPSG